MCAQVKSQCIFVMVKFKCDDVREFYLKCRNTYNFVAFCVCALALATTSSVFDNVMSMTLGQ